MKTLARNPKTGFTIVELLIVIIVIGILAALVLVAYSNVTNQAKNSAVQNNLLSSMKNLAIYSENNGVPALTDVQTGGTATPSFGGNGNYQIASYCYTSSTFVIAAISAPGNTYYVKRNGPVTLNNSLSISNPCTTLGITNADGTTPTAGYLGVSTTACASENGTCTFTGTKTVIFGYAPKFNYKANMTSPVTCSNTVFGDPYSGQAKSCYVASYD